MRQSQSETVSVERQGRLLNWHIPPAPPPTHPPTRMHAAFNLTCVFPPRAKRPVRRFMHCYALSRTVTHCYALAGCVLVSPLARSLFVAVLQFEAFRVVQRLNSTHCQLSVSQFLLSPLLIHHHCQCQCQSRHSLPATFVRSLPSSSAICHLPSARLHALFPRRGDLCA